MHRRSLQFCAILFPAMCTISWQRISFTVITVFVILGSTTCQDSPSIRYDVEYPSFPTTFEEFSPTPASPKETYVSNIEKFIRTLAKPVNAIENTVSAIGKSIKGALSYIPVIGNAVNKSEGTAKSVADALNPFKDGIKAIYPGTYWCGDGDIAKEEEDLGLFRETDACCRAHDSCPDGIPSQEERFGLLNNGLFTRSACYCDEEFYRCLKEAKSIVATKIGTTYFNVLRPQCFREDYSVTNCNKYTRNRLIDDKCAEYNYNYTAPTQVQWFDNPDFLG